MAESLVVKAKIKEYAKGFNVGGDIADALSGMAGKLIDEACKRAESNNRKTVMAKDLSHSMICSCKAKENLVVKSKVKEHAKGVNVAGDFPDSLNCVLGCLVEKACKRAEGNNRKTVMAKDL